MRFFALLPLFACLVPSLPAHAETPVVPDVPDVTLTLESRARNVTWYTQTLGSAAQELCLAPCVAQVPVGERRFGLKAGAREVVWDPSLYTVRGPTRLDGRYRSRRGLRFAGIGAIGGGIVLGTVTYVVGTLIRDLCKDRDPDIECDPDDRPTGKAISIVGVVIAVAGVAAGLVMMTQKDKARVIGLPRAPVQPEEAQFEPAAPPPKPDYMTLNPGVLGCLRSGGTEVATVRVSLDERSVVQEAQTLDAPIVAACVREALRGRRVPHAPAGNKTLRFRLPAP